MNTKFGKRFLYTLLALMVLLASTTTTVVRAEEDLEEEAATAEAAADAGAVAEAYAAAVKEGLEVAAAASVPELRDHFEVHKEEFQAMRLDDLYKNNTIVSQDFIDGNIQ